LIEVNGTRNSAYFTSQEVKYALRWTRQPQSCRVRAA